MKLNEYFKQEGHGSMSLMAEALGVSVAHVHHWANGKRNVTHEWALEIEGYTGAKVTRRDLCADWAKHWPELAQAQQPATLN